MYKLQENGVKRLSDNAHIPSVPGNKDWKEYQVWLDKGNTPESQYTQEELDQIERQKKIRQKITDIKEELRNAVPSQSLSELAARVEKLEIVLGIKESRIL